MRSRRAVVAVLGLAGAAVATPQLLSASPAAAGVSVDQVYRVPASGRLTVDGHGYGHGHGMSQWGAQGAALKGLAYQDILDFYYPGTAVGRASKKVRVLISADTTPDVIVDARHGLGIRDLGAGTTYRLPTGLGAERWRLTTDGQNRDVVEYDAGKGWRSWSPGGSATLEGQGEFRAKGALTLTTPSGTRVYRGWLRAARPSATSTDRDTVNVVKMDSYVKGVVPSEAYTSWEPAALQAQAVAARTYAAFEQAANRDRYYQICDTSSCQVYGGKDREVSSTNAAVDATSREILTYGGEPAFTLFSSSSGGWTADGGSHTCRRRRTPTTARRAIRCTAGPRRSRRPRSSTPTRRSAGSG
ncbi:MAG: stage sporulation protein [Nocardioidaceae bacterium]|nr:stage sporulation protein [Nocardioidaceae bacterium]